MEASSGPVIGEEVFYLSIYPCHGGSNMRKAKTKISPKSQDAGKNNTTF
jgi:hypothetical protein